MFTGLVEEAGRVVSFEQGSQAWLLEVEAPKLASEMHAGDSLAVNGCCLTVARQHGTRIGFDLLGETVRLTNFQHLQTGARVNLERSLRADDRLGGHFVSGHIDGLATIADIRREGPDTVMQMQPDDPSALRLLVHKGSIAVDGVSLTVASLDEASFTVWLIPTTLQVTNLGTRQEGDRVNLECDLLAKHVEKLLAWRDGKAIST